MENFTGQTAALCQIKQFEYRWCAVPRRSRLLVLATMAVVVKQKTILLAPNGAGTPYFTVEPAPSLLLTEEPRALII